MTLTVKILYDNLNQLAPFDTAESWDNVGLIIGDFHQTVTGILCALDCTLQVIEEALQKNANVIFTHHPLLFSPVQTIDVSEGEGAVIAALIKNNITLLSAHTNGDLAPLGIGATLAKLLELSNLRQEEYLFCGTLPHSMALPTFISFAQKKLQTTLRVYGSVSTPITRLAVGGGACGDMWPIAKKLGAQGLLTGEIKHHDIVRAVEAGFLIFDGGHFATEVPGLFSLGQCLQKALNALQYKVGVYYSSIHPYQK